MFHHNRQSSSGLESRSHYFAAKKLKFIFGCNSYGSSLSILVSKKRVTTVLNNLLRRSSYMFCLTILLATGWKFSSFSSHLSAAFKTVDHSSHLSFGLSSTTIEWMTGTQQSVCHEGSSCIPQDPALGPIPFQLNSFDILAILLKHDLHCYLYPEDSQMNSFCFLASTTSS